MFRPVDTKKIKNLVTHFGTLDGGISCLTLFIVKHDSVLDLTLEYLFNRKTKGHSL